MRQKLFIFLGLILLVGLLIGINAVSYVQKDKEPDEEGTPNRSTYNTGSTGTRAFYDLLSATGRKVTRWQEKSPGSFSDSKDAPQTFVIIGQTRLEFEEGEIQRLLKWVSEGGKLVIIDRDPHEELIKTTANRLVTTVPGETVYSLDPTDQPLITKGAVAAQPLQPTVFTRNVIAVQPSRFASSIKISPFSDAGAPDKTPTVTPTSKAISKLFYQQNIQEDKPPPVKAPPKIVSGSGNPPLSGPKPKPTPLPTVETAALDAPFVHIATPTKNILVDFPYGSGQIVYLTDPYIVSNAGINLVDNAQLGLNIVSAREGLIAFDEYHQGYGISSPVFDYFEGTPIIAIFSQILLLVGLIFFTQSRRFARPLPADEPNRLSKLEYISAMAELQQSTRAYDLAVENIYTEFRRSITRLFGVDNFTTSRRQLAVLISERTKFNPAELEKLMQQCEYIIHGEPTNKREVLELTSRLREIEEKLNLKRKRKEAFKK